MAGQHWTGFQIVVDRKLLHEKILVQDTTLKELSAPMKALLAPFTVKNRVFMLDYDRVFKSTFVRHGKQTMPIEFGEAGQTVAPPTLAKNAASLDAVFEYLGIFGVQHVNTIKKFVECGEGINPLPDEMGGVKFETDLF